MPVREYDPAHDKNAALKICIDALLLDKRFDDLVALLSDDTNVDELQGEPGWSLELRKGHAHARAVVEQEALYLSYPEYGCSRSELWAFIKHRIETSPKIINSDAYKASTLAGILLKQA